MIRKNKPMRRRRKPAEDFAPSAKIWSVSIVGSTKYFSTVDTWGDQPILMIKAEANFLKWQLEKEYHGNIKVNKHD